jgi:protein-S-isoprenylcysteine O-methyltransferase Ste14
MPYVALAGYAIFLVLAFGLRTVIQFRRTGDSGFRGVSGRPGSAEWFAGRLFTVALVIGVLAPVLALTGTVEPIAALDETAVHITGIVVFLIGLGLTLASQFQMGESWRVGVEESERTDLVESGLFGLVRNPIFSAMLLVTIGLVAIVPSVVAFVGLVALLVALELQVRIVEEPYLLRTQGEPYAAYARRVGRFVPGIGGLREPE